MVGLQADDRFRIILRIVPPADVLERIADFLAKQRAVVDKQQNYNPLLGIHFTLFSTISCHKNFHYRGIDVLLYIEQILRVQQEQPPFKMQLRCVMVGKVGACGTVSVYDRYL
ncbi:hypothetical protein [Sphingobacterium suaedae]|uniref:2'-5' RNA ligase family protein n=1 Tax=Sphingobacterium suaedae TaxID=1686402 RepID=A0ABW5KHQ2_9SPHI